MENVNKYYVDVLKKHYAEFSGKSTRREFWMFVLFNVIVSIVFSVIDSMLFGNNSNPLSMIYSLAVLVPSIAIAIRRMHDIGKSGWYLLVGLIPIVGWLVLLYFYVQPSKK